MNAITRGRLGQQSNDIRRLRADQSIDWWFGCFGLVILNIELSVWYGDVAVRRDNLPDLPAALRHSATIDPAAR